MEKGFTAVLVVHEANRALAIMASRRRQLYRRICRGPSGPVSRPTLSPACCWDSLQRIRTGPARSWHRPAQTCAAALRHGRRPHRRARADCQRGWHWRCCNLETTRFHSLKRRSARPVQVDCRHCGIASL